MGQRRDQAKAVLRSITADADERDIVLDVDHCCDNFDVRSRDVGS